MAIQFPTTEIPLDVIGPDPVDPRARHVSPLSSSMQVAGSSTQLHEMTFISRPYNTDEYRVIKALTDKFIRDEVILSVWEKYKPNAYTLGATDYITHEGVLVTHLGEPVWYSAPFTGDVKVGAGASSFTLPITGAPTGLDWKAGQPISISTGGRWYLYTLAADSPAGSTSKTLTLTSAIRAAHASGDIVVINRAYIQGDGIAEWNPDWNRRYYQLRLTVREVK